MSCPVCKSCMTEEELTASKAFRSKNRTFHMASGAFIQQAVISPSRRDLYLAAADHIVRDYCLLDKSAGSHVKSTIFTLPGKLGKGVLVAPTGSKNKLHASVSSLQFYGEAIHSNHRRFLFSH